MIDRNDLGSWLDGPPPAQEYPGQRLGRPDSGPGSVARFGPRLVALLIDWFIALGLSALLVFDSAQNIGALGIWLVITVLSVGLVGHTVGHFVMGMQVQTMDGHAPGFLRGVIRTLLVFLIVPPLLMDPDQRGLQDRVVGTVLVKIR